MTLTGADTCLVDPLRLVTDGTETVFRLRNVGFLLYETLAFAVPLFCRRRSNAKRTVDRLFVICCRVVNPPALHVEYSCTVRAVHSSCCQTYSQAGVQLTIMRYVKCDILDIADTLTVEARACLALITQRRNVARLRGVPAAFEEGDCM